MGERQDRTAAGAQSREMLGDLLRRGAVLSPDCPSRGILKHLTSRWAVLVLIALLDGTHRFAELRRKIGIVSEKMLSQTLQVLEADGFVIRHDHQVVPPRVDYQLTPLGREAADKVRLLVDWIEQNIHRIPGAAERETAPEEVPEPFEA